MIASMVRLGETPFAQLLPEIPLVSVVIINYNGKDLLEDCLKSVLATNYPSFEVILVDNGSTDGSLEQVRRWADKNHSVRPVELQTNIGVTRAFNLGVSMSKGKLVASLNNDTVVDPDWLLECVHLLESDAKIGAVQCKLLSYHNGGRFDSAGCSLDRCGHARERGHFQEDLGQYDNPTEIFSAGLPASVYSRYVLDKVGVLDPDFFAGYEDADLCWRVWLSGHAVMFVPKAIVRHKRSSTSGRSEIRTIISWNFSKNWMTMLLKNYSGWSLIRVFHRIIGTMTILSLGYLVVGRGDQRLVGIRAIIWNVRNLRGTLQKRWVIQRRIRKIRDNSVMSLMQPGCILIQHYRLYLHQLRGGV